MCHASLTPAVEANPPMAIRTCMVLRDPGQLSSPRSPMIAGRNRDLHGTERSWSTLPNRHRMRGVQGGVTPCLHVFLDTPRDYASLAFFMHSKTLQGATLRLPLPLWRTPHGDRDCIGGVKVKPKSPRSTLPNRHRMRGVQGGATPLSA